MKLIPKTIALGLIALSTSASADVWAERQALAQISTEIKALERLVHDASEIPVEDSRIQFGYKSLMYDLEKVREGIEDHLAQPINPVTPSQIKNLRGEYTEVNR